MKNIQIKELEFTAGNPKICVPLMGADKEHILHDLESLKSLDFDLVELRIDHYNHVENFEMVGKLLGAVRENCEKPVLFTFRTSREGGVHEMSEEKYFELNRLVVKSGFVDLIDIELFSSEEPIKSVVSHAHEKGVRVVMSSHDFHKTPPKDEIVRRLVKMQDYGADITKIAVMPNCEEDVLVLMEAALEMKKVKADRPFITMSMGALGAVTRLTGDLCGSCLTFASLNKASAPGQMSVKSTREILNLLKIQ